LLPFKKNVLITSIFFLNLVVVLFLCEIIVPFDEERKKLIIATNVVLVKSKQLALIRRRHWE